MENLNQAFAQINQAFSHTNGLLSQRNASNGDIPATEVVHVPNLNDVQPFMTVPMEVDASGGIPEAGTVPFPDFFEGVEDVELFEQVENAINNSWRFDLYKNSAPAAPEEPDPTFGLTKEESTWLLMLMRGPVLEARARANQEASYLRSLGSTTYTKEHYLRSSDLTTKEFDKEVNEFFGGDNGDDEEDVEMDIDEDTSEDELCLIKTSWTTPAKKTEVTAVDYTDPVSPFDHHLEERLAGNAVDEDDEMNPEGVFRPLNDSALEMEEGFASEVQKRSISNTVAIPKTLDKTVDVDDEESEYEAPGTFGTPPSPNNNYTHGPFMTENIDLHPDRPAEAVLPGHMTLNGSDRNQDHNSELSPEQLEQAIASLKKSDQPMNLVSSEGETILNTISGAGLQVGVELNASATKRNADSPGPFTKLLDFTDDDEMPTALDTRTADLGMEELALGERVYKSTTMEEIPALRRSRIPSPSKSFRPITPAALTTAISSNTSFHLMSSKPVSPSAMPKPRGRHFNQTINTNTQDLVCNPSPTSSSGPLTPKDKTVKAIFASPKITQTAAGKRERKKYRKRACADRQIVDTAVGGGDDDYGGEIVDGRDEEEEVCFERRGTEVGQVQPDSAIDVSFPGAGEVSPTAKMKKKIARSRKVKKTDGGVTTIHKEKSGAAAEASATRAEEGMDKPPPKKRTRRSTRNSGVAGSGA